jgi:hypothetical protein
MIGQDRRGDVVTVLILAKNGDLQLETRQNILGCE